MVDFSLQSAKFDLSMNCFCQSFDKGKQGTFTFHDWLKRGKNNNFDKIEFFWPKSLP